MSEKTRSIVLTETQVQIVALAVALALLGNVVSNDAAMELQRIFYPEYPQKVNGDVQ